jgi:putative restriction endonuclease
MIGGYGVLSHASNLPLSLAWEAFGIKNGANSFSEMRAKITKYRKTPVAGDYTIGCRIVVDPVFFPEHLWVPQPASWANAIVVGKRYDTDDVEGKRLWNQLQETTLQARGRLIGVEAPQMPYVVGDEKRTGQPQLVFPRLGQGAFRIAVTDAYRRECALTNGRVLPALEAAHIKSWSEGGAHDVRNGLLLRRDIHRVLDAGYATFDEDHRFVVSDRVRTEFNNGEEYRRLQGFKLKPPAHPLLSPDPSALEWHRNNIYLG